MPDPSNKKYIKIRVLAPRMKTQEKYKKVAKLTKYIYKITIQA